MHTGLTLDAIASKLLSKYGTGKETEADWEAMESLLRAAIQKIDALGKNNLVTVGQVLQAGQASQAVCGFLRKMTDVLAALIISERTRLAAAAMDCVKTALKACSSATNTSALSISSSSGLEGAYWEALLGALFKVAERNNKVQRDKAKACLIAILPHASLKLALSKLAFSAASLNKVLRQVVIECIQEAYFVGQALNSLADDPEALPTIVKILKTALTDASEGVRDVARSCYSAMSKKYPDAHRLFNLANHATANRQSLAGNGASRPLSVTSSRASASSSVLRMPRVVGTASSISAVSEAILGPQRISTTAITAARNNSKDHVSDAHGAPKRALRVAPSLLHSQSTLGGSRPLLSKPQTPSGSMMRPSPTTARMSHIASPSTLRMSTLSTATINGQKGTVMARACSEWLAKGSKASDWMARLTAFNTLSQLVITKDANELETTTAKERLAQVLIQAFSDTHVKLHRAALDLTDQIGPLLTDLKDEHRELLLTRMLLVCRKEQDVLDVARKLLIPSSVPLLMTMLGKPMNLKIRKHLLKLILLNIGYLSHLNEVLNSKAIIACLDNDDGDDGLSADATAIFVKVHDALGDDKSLYYNAINTAVKSSAARQMLREALQSRPILPAKSPIPATPHKKLEQIQEEDLEERNKKDSPSRTHSICITPIKPVDTESTGKRPAAVLTPLQASVRKRIETAVRQAISQQTTPSQPKMNDEKNADDGSNVFSSPSPLKSPTTKNSIDVAGTPVDRLVYKVKQRIRAAFENIQSNNELEGALQPIITAREVGSVETTLTPIKSVSESKVDDSELALALLTSPPIAKSLTFAADGSEEAVVGKIIQELLAQPHLTPTKALVQECLSTTTSQGTDASNLAKYDNFILVFVAVDVAEDEDEVVIKQNIIKEDTGMPMDSDGEVVFVRRGPMASIF